MFRKYLMKIQLFENILYRVKWHLFLENIQVVLHNFFRNECLTSVMQLDTLNDKINLV